MAFFDSKAAHLHVMDTHYTHWIIYIKRRFTREFIVIIVVILGEKWIPFLSCELEIMVEFATITIIALKWFNFEMSDESKTSNVARK